LAKYLNVTYAKNEELSNMMKRHGFGALAMGCLTTIALLAGCGGTTGGHEIDSTTVSAICATSTHCSLTITNDTGSQHDLQWQIITSPASATIAPMMGTLSPGKAANVGISATSTLCGATIAIQETRAGKVNPHPGSLTLTCN
jgi:hypothetical protein